MNTLTLNPSQEERLDRVATILGKAPTELLNEHISELIDELLEDLEDIAIATERLAEVKAGAVKPIPMEQFFAEMEEYADEEDHG